MSDDKYDLETELLAICDWMIANTPDALRLDTTISSDAIALMTAQAALIEELQRKVNAADAYFRNLYVEPSRSVTLNVPTDFGAGKSLTTAELVALHAGVIAAGELVDDGDFEDCAPRLTR